MLGCSEQSSSLEETNVLHDKLPSFFLVNINYFFNPQACMGLLKCFTVYFTAYIILQVILTVVLYTKFPGCLK